MKTNKKNVLIATLMTATGISLVGSIAGTFAWYQYSTRATVSYMGSSAHCTENFKVSVDGDESTFVSELVTNDITGAATANFDGTAFQPVTSATAALDGELDAAALALFKGHAKYQDFAYNKWQAAPVNSFLQFDLYFAVEDITGASTKSYLEKDVYFEEVVLEWAANGSTSYSTSGDFLNAIRVHVYNASESTAVGVLGLAADTTVLGGNLDLNGDGVFDTQHGYEWESLSAQKYGDDSLEQDVEAFADYTAAYTNGNLDVSSASALGTTTTDISAPLHLVFTVWLEGWANTGTSAATSIWDAADYIGNFHFGMTFGVTNHEDHA